MSTLHRPAHELVVDNWLNIDEPITLKKLRGRVVVVFAFQMLCPGCVDSSIPQAKRVYQTFSQEDVAVLGLHTVFEHHEAMTETSLKAFIQEYRIPFPVGTDKPASEEFETIPTTMKTYAMQGTPSMLLIDEKGLLRSHRFGHEHDLALGAQIMALLKEDNIVPTESKARGEVCTPEGCV